MARASVIALACALGAPLAAQDLSGRWVLYEAGDTVAAVVRSDSAGPAPAAPPPVRTGRGMSDRQRLGLVLGMAGAVRAFRLAPAGDSIVVTNEDGFVYVLRPGGDEARLTILDSVTVRYRARWDGAFLEVEWRPDTGGKLTERYQLADSGLYLRLDVAVEYQRFRQRESRLYRLAPEAGSTDQS